MKLGWRRVCAGVVLMLSARWASTQTPVKEHWQPVQRLTFFWQLQGVPPAMPVMATDMDGFDNEAGTVDRLHAAGQHVLCYIDAGTFENFRPDAAKFPGVVQGASNGWPGERWLDIRRLDVLGPILLARMRMCREKHFDAVEPDNVDGYANKTGFPLTAADQLTFNRWLAAQAHAMGMAIFLKNDPEQVKVLEPEFDGVVNEQCNQYHECGAFAPFLAAGKPVLDIEYNAGLYPSFCRADERLKIMGALLNKKLDGKLYKPCWAMDR
jgi:hypothetical protein